MADPNVPIPLPGAAKSPELPDLPKHHVNLATTGKVTGDYRLVDNSNADETWSRPEWARFYKKNLAAIVILVGALTVLVGNVDREDVRLLAASLGLTAGYTLLNAEASQQRRGK